MEIWALLLSFGTKADAFNEQYEIYYRCNRFMPRETWIQAKFNWCLQRIDKIECCIQPERSGYPPWFICNDFFGFDSLVVEKRNHEPNGHYSDSLYTRGE